MLPRGLSHGRVVRCLLGWKEGAGSGSIPSRVEKGDGAVVGPRGWGGGGRGCCQGSVTAMPGQVQKLQGDVGSKRAWSWVRSV